MTKVVAVFHLQEDVTPDLFIEKIAQACMDQGALRQGESVQAANSQLIFTVVKNEDMSAVSWPTRIGVEAVPE